MVRLPPPLHTSKSVTVLGQDGALRQMGLSYLFRNAAGFMGSLELQVDDETITVRAHHPRSQLSVSLPWGTVGQIHHTVSQRLIPSIDPGSHP